MPAQEFASLFTDARARRALTQFGPHTRLPLFNLATTSLRHLNKWLDRLDAINRGVRSTHGNYYSDPASIGLVDATVQPRALTAAGQAFLAFRAQLRNDPARAEYELLKILYFGGFAHRSQVQEFLSSKRGQLLAVLEQYTPSPSRHVFLDNPRLLVVAELLAGFPGAVPSLLQLPARVLRQLANLGESGFTALCAGGNFPRGLNRLCRRIGGDYTRGEERRLHYLVSMALLTIAQSIPAGTSVPLAVPHPFSNLLTEMDIYNLHAQYTTDITVWFDGVRFQVTTSLTIPRGVPVGAPQVQLVTLEPQTNTPAGTGIAAPDDRSRSSRRRARRSRTTVIIDQVLSERAEDLAQQRILEPQYGTQLVRVGHTTGETLSLPDGMVPGADFYVINAAGNPGEFVEIKSVTGNPPFEASFTRAEYLRAERCSLAGIPYRLILVDVETGRFYEVGNFARGLSTLRLGEVVQFVIRIVL